MKLASEASFWFAIALSALLHAAVWVADARRVERPTAIRLDDRWATSSIEVGTEPEPAPAPVSAPAPESGPASSPSPPAAAEATEMPAIIAPPPPPVAAAADTPAARKPKPEHPRVVRPTAPAPATASAPEGVGSAAAAIGPSGSMGALELPPGVRHLAPAFTRALPASSYADPRWSELPTGSLGRVELEIVVDEDGHISDVSFDPRKPPTPVVEQLVKNTVLLLKAGVFSIDARTVSAGRERLALEVSLSDEPSPAPDSAPQGLFRKGFEPPSPSRPGYARFTLNSGRHMEAIVRILTP